MRWLWAALAVLGLAAMALGQTNRYVDVSIGSNAGTCTASDPATCYTIAYAITQSASGDNIYIEDGTYPTLALNAADTKGINFFGRNGAASAVILSDATGSPTIDLRNQATNITHTFTDIDFAKPAGANNYVARLRGTQTASTFTRCAFTQSLSYQNVYIESAGTAFRDISFVDCQLSGPSTQIDLAGQVADLSISGSTTTINSSASIALNLNATAEGVTITNADIDAAGTAAINIGASFLPDAGGFQMTGGSVTTTGANITGILTNAATVMEQGLIDNVTFDTTGPCIYLEAMTLRNIVEDCALEVTSADQGFIMLDIGLRNITRRNTFTPFATMAANGSFAARGRYGVFEDNQIYGHPGYGIICNGFEYVIQRNRISALYGIKIEGGRRNLVQNNTFYGTGPDGDGYFNIGHGHYVEAGGMPAVELAAAPVYESNSNLSWVKSQAIGGGAPTGSNRFLPAHVGATFTLEEGPAAGDYPIAYFIDADEIMVVGDASAGLATNDFNTSLLPTDNIFVNNICVANNTGSTTGIDAIRDYEGTGTFNLYDWNIYWTNQITSANANVVLLDYNNTAVTVPWTADKAVDLAALQAHWANPLYYTDLVTLNDANSILANPLIISTLVDDNFLKVPRSSPVRGAASHGGDIGAAPVPHRGRLFVVPP